MASSARSDTSPVRRDESEIRESDKVRKEVALIDAAALGKTDKLLKLLQSGVSVEAEAFNEGQWRALRNTETPLQSASGKGYPECVQILIDYRANVSAADCTGMTALHFAAEKGHVECIQKLLQAGAVCSSGTFVEPKYIRYFGKPYANGTTALHIAVANNHVDCAKILIRYGADYNAVDEFKRSSLYIAAKSGFTECVAAHLDIHHPQPLRFLPSFYAGNTPLHYAVQHGMQECVRKLAILGSDANHINRAGFSPLHIAAASGFDLEDGEKMLETLVKECYKTDVNLATPEGFKPLHYVGFNITNYGLRRQPGLAKILISYGADVNITFGQRASLLEWELNSPSTDDGSFLRYILRSMHRLQSLERRVYPRRIRFSNDYPNVDIPTRRAVDCANWLPNIVQKWTWYNELVSQIPPLLHFCRYAVRKCLGTHGLTRVEELNIPAELLPYLLLKDCSLDHIKPPDFNKELH